MKTIKHQYLTKEERRVNNVGVNASNRFNDNMPHYLFAYSLFNRQHQSNFKDFMTYGVPGVPGVSYFEIAHGYMHSNYGKFDGDAPYAI
jgi:hypothetical protein